MSVDIVKYSADQALSSSELIARWNVVSSSLDERSVLSKLCGGCITLFKQFLVSTLVKDRVAPVILRNLDRSRCTLSLWADAYRVPEGGLDVAAEESRYLRRKVLQLLSSIAGALTERLLPKLRVQDSFVTDQLDSWRQEALTAVQQDYRDREAHDSESESDGSDSDMSVSNDLEDIVESLETDTQLLMELDRFIQAPSFSIPAIEQPKEQAIVNWEPQDAFAQIIRKRFPDAIGELVDALAKANLNRMQRCAEARESSAGNAESEEQRITLVPRAITAPTVGCATQDDSGYGTMQAVSARAESKYTQSQYAETIMSYAAGDRTVKIPALPAGAKEGKPFECVACGKSVSFTRSKMWKRHLFSDLQPWTCLEPGCKAEIKTFNTHETWVQHLEFDHEYGPDWESRPCPLCKEDTGEGMGACSKHLSTHLEEISLATLPRPTDEDDVSQLSISSNSSASDQASIDLEGDLDRDLEEAFNNMQDSDDSVSQMSSVESPIGFGDSEFFLSASSYRCAVPNCGRAFDAEHKLNHHTRYHQREHKCPYEGCAKEFGTKTHLQRHVNDRHLPSRKTYHCAVDECDYSKRGGKSFPRKDNWRRHMVKKHGIDDRETSEAHLSPSIEDSSAWPRESDLKRTLPQEQPLDWPDDNDISIIVPTTGHVAKVVKVSDLENYYFAQNRLDPDYVAGRSVKEDTCGVVLILSRRTLDDRLADWWLCQDVHGKMEFVPNTALTALITRPRSRKSQAIKPEEIMSSIPDHGTPWGTMLEAFRPRIGRGTDQMPVADFLATLGEICVWQGSTLLKPQISNAEPDPRVMTNKLVEEPMTEALWESRRSLIVEYYKSNPVQEVKRIMEEWHNFKASKGSYVQHLESWGAREDHLEDKDWSSAAPSPTASPSAQPHLHVTEDQIDKLDIDRTNTEVEQTTSKESEAEDQDKRHQCPYCDQKFPRDQVWAHVLTHGFDKPYNCGSCDMFYDNADDLRYHARLHKGSHPLMCEHCASIFSLGADLERHKESCVAFTYHAPEDSDLERNVHRLTPGTIRPYPCPYREKHGCEKTFTTSNHAARHGRTHIPEKPMHWCTFPGCQKKFTRASNMRQHLQTHFKDKGSPSSKEAHTKVVLTEASSAPEEQENSKLDRQRPQQPEVDKEGAEFKSRHPPPPPHHQQQPPPPPPHHEGEGRFQGFPSRFHAFIANPWGPPGPPPQM